MGIEYYAFALFVTGLICLIAILCKVLFADVRRQRKLLDEKETKLLRLYQSVEDVIEEFNSQVEETKEEIKKQQTAAAAMAAERELLPPKAHYSPNAYAIQERNDERRMDERRAEERRFEEFKTNETRPGAIIDTMAVGEVKKKQQEAERQDSAPTFQRMIDELIDEPVMPGGQTKNGRNNAVLRLKNEGRTVAQIAQELGITQNEVKLIIGLNR